MMKKSLGMMAASTMAMCRSRRGRCCCWVRACSRRCADVSADSPHRWYEPKSSLPRVFQPEALTYSPDKIHLSRGSIRTIDSKPATEYKSWTK